MDKSRPLTTADDILPRLNFIRNKKQEYVVCLSLDSTGRVIIRRVVAIGTLTASLIHPREVFAGPLKDRAASVIVAHNHPSGIAEPSSADIEMTQQLAAAGQILGVPLKDHLIVGREDYYSFKKNRMI